MIAWLACVLGEARADDTAEAARLGEELVRLAEKNSWTGVDRTYEQLLALDAPKSAAQHLIGGQAALVRGDALLAWYRFERVATPTPSTPPDEVAAYENASREAKSIEDRFGKVALCVGPGRLRVLVRPEMPFAQIEKDAIALVAQRIRDTGCYRGLLPVGRYELDGQPFELAGGPGWVVVDVGE